MIGACATTAANASPSATGLNDARGPIPRAGSHLAALPQKGTGSKLMVPHGVSGGGLRLAAFACGARKDLKEFSLPDDGADANLLDPGDIISISAVSGGSAAAHYARHRDHIFTDFDKDFLSRRINNHNRGGFPSWNFRWSFDKKRGANDRIAGVYGRLMFHGATHADLQKQGRPPISIDAIDVDYGLPFALVQGDLICSGFSPLPLVAPKSLDADTTYHVRLPRRIDSDNFETVALARRQLEILREKISWQDCGHGVTDSRSCGNAQAGQRLDREDIAAQTEVGRRQKLASPRHTQLRVGLDANQSKLLTGN